MRSLNIVALVVLTLIGLMSIASAQNSADALVAKEFKAVEMKLEAMAGSGDDKLRRAEMDAFREACQAFITRHEANASKLTSGHFDLARGYLHLGQPDQAASHLEFFAKLLPQHERAEDAQLLLGDAYRSLDRLPDAVALFRQFVAQRPKSENLPFARLHLGNSLLLSMDFAGAIGEFQVVRTTWPKHQAAASASLQMIEASVNAGDFGKARAVLAELMAENPEAPALLRLQNVLGMLGQPSPDLGKAAQWIGTPSSNISRLKGRVVVLCFFMNWSAPCTYELQFLSGLLEELEPQGLTVWGVTKTYKTGKRKWTLDREVQWLEAYRKTPGRIIREELGVSEAMIGEDPSRWANLERPISCPFSLMDNFDTHKAFQVRGVPCVVVIDKNGAVQMIKEGGSSSGGFQRRLVSRLVKKLLRQ